MNSTLLNKEIQFENSSVLNKTPNIIEEFRSSVEVTTLTVLFFLTIIGNASVIVLLMLFNKKRNKGSSQTSVSRMSFYIIHLSIADISVAFMSILPQILWRNSVIFMNSQFLCKLVTFTQIFSVYASTFVLIVMAYDRYTCICSPIKSCLWNNKSALVEIGIAWLLAAIISSPQLFLFKIQNVQVNNVTVETCYVKWGSKYREALYLIFHTSTQFIVPLIILIFFYTNIFLTVAKNKHFKTVRLSFESQGQNSSTKTDSPRSRLRSDSQRSQNTNNSALKSSLKYSKDVNNSNDPNSNQSLLNQNKHNINNSNAEDSIVIWRRRPSYDSKPKSLRHNYSKKVFTKSKMKTLKLTLTVVIAYVLCSLPFYISTLFIFIIGSSIKKSSDSFTQILRIKHFASLKSMQFGFYVIFILILKITYQC